MILLDQKQIVMLPLGVVSCVTKLMKAEPICLITRKFATKPRV